MNPVHFSSATPEWATPQDLFDRLNAIHRFTLDVCATAENAKCARFFTRESDGLAQSWAGARVWCNPPYGREIGAWVAACARAKAWGLREDVPRLAVMLLPARTDTAWWHDYVIPYGRIDFIRGRLKFGGHKNSAPFPSAVVLFAPSADDSPERTHA